MAQFEGVKWAESQMRYLLNNKKQDFLAGNDRVFAVSRSIHYGLFLAFEGIRFFSHKNKDGKLEVIFLNWKKNLERFKRSISFNLSTEQQKLVPTLDELLEIFMNYFKRPDMQNFLEEMAEKKAQGYLRPFTVDEEQSIGVTFPACPAIRAVACRYDRYLGEPFDGVVIPHMVRAVGVNQTGCLKLGINYLISVKAIEEAKKIYPKAASALFLDDNPRENFRKRNITEWDSSCCLIVLTDGSVIKIPESNLILPSVTIQGIVAILKSKGIPVHEREMTYGELIDKVNAKEVVTICSIGTAGILNRCNKLMLIDDEKKIIAKLEAQEAHEMFKTIGTLKEYYWKIYTLEEDAPPGIEINKYII